MKPPMVMRSIRVLLRLWFGERRDAYPCRGTVFLSQQDATIAAKQEQARMEDPAMTDVYSCVDLHWHYRLLHQRP